MTDAACGMKATPRLHHTGISAILAGKLCFQRRDAGGKRLVFVACLDRHLAHGFEFLALDDVHAVQPTLGLGVESRLDLLADSLGSTCRVGHQLGELIHDAVRSGRHGVFLPSHAVNSALQGLED
ncbi:hypothetical conserved protein [Rhizobium etli CIAT 652]|uniref:Hypothetical conserved protein n=1 Tax=Rhizobium etli (strain CIAT 652) TaxID=491916 RepID=B3PUZ8_RHIE6|nr:hypothetical conserved protein [Rhizobium etli CIAT 652]KKZ86316.1 hypothetical protein RPHASCH2410_CH17640 [Rhizobium phaseoli Ch24-10]